MFPLSPRRERSWWSLNNNKSGFVFMTKNYCVLNHWFPRRTFILNYLSIKWNSFLKLQSERCKTLNSSINLPGKEKRTYRLCQDIIFGFLPKICWKRTWIKTALKTVRSTNVGLYRDLNKYLYISCVFKWFHNLIYFSVSHCEREKCT